MSVYRKLGHTNIYMIKAKDLPNETALFFHYLKIKCGVCENLVSLEDVRKQIEDSWPWFKLWGSPHFICGMCSHALNLDSPQYIYKCPHHEKN
jgi:uncharacterized CHY-type Zn-finger protein